MSPILVTGVVIVNLALLCYTVGILIEQRSHVVSRRVLFFLTTGVVFDVIATVCMILGSERGLGLHAVLGFSSLAAMILETSLAWRHRLAFGDGRVPRWLHLYSRVAYLWWIAAYFTGAALVMSAAD